MMREVKVIIAPKEPAGVMLVPGYGLVLLDRPANPGFKAWVDGDTKTWEYGKTHAECICSMQRRAAAESFVIIDVERQQQPVS